MGLLHPALMKSSGWTYNRRYREILAARWWGCPSPGFFFELPKDERLDILAAYESHWRIEAINSYEATEEAKRKAQKPRRK